MCVLKVFVLTSWRLFGGLKRTAIAETKAVFEPLLQRIEDALEKLSDLVEVAEEEGKGRDGGDVKKAGELEKAKEVVLLARERLDRK